MDQGPELRERVLAALLAPIRDICGRPLGSLLVSDGRTYRLAEDLQLPSSFTDPATAQYCLTLLVFYVEKMAACIRLDAGGTQLRIDEGLAAALPLQEAALPQALHNAKRLSEALAPYGGRQLLTAVILSCKFPELSEDRQLYQQIVSQVISKGLKKCAKT